MQGLKGSVHELDQGRREGEMRLIMKLHVQPAKVGRGQDEVNEVGEACISWIMVREAREMRLIIKLHVLESGLRTWPGVL